MTICEELYWHPHFIIGSILNNSIQELWQSDKALSLYYVHQSDISEQSACHDCTQFEECRSLKKVCYRDVVQKYGFDKWDFPDAKCPRVQKH